MEGRPLPDEAPRRTRMDVSNDHFPVKIELPLLALVLGVEVSRLMLAVEHSNDDSEEDRDDRHASSLPLWANRAGLTSAPGRDLHYRSRQRPSENSALSSFQVPNLDAICPPSTSNAAPVI